WANLLVLTFLLLPLVAFAFERFAGRMDQGEDASGSIVLLHFLFMFCPSAVVLGFVHWRALAERFRLRLSRVARDRLVLNRLLTTFGPILLLLVAACLLVWPGLSASSSAANAVGLLLVVIGELLGFWLVGVCLAALTSSTEFLLRSLRRWQS